MIFDTYIQLKATNGTMPILSQSKA